jgi:hypothetical protein
VIVLDSTILRFDTPHEPSLSSQMNIRWDGNYSFVLPALLPYINSIQSEVDGTGSVDDLIVQLSGDDTLFSRIVLFSARGPKPKPELKNIIVDWITPEEAPLVGRPSIDGYFLSHCADMNEQIARLVKNIANGSDIFNLVITTSIAHYKCHRQTYKYAGATSEFCQSFKLLPSKLSNSVVPAIFAVEVSYVRFKKRVSLKELIWTTQSFKKSNDFIPVCASVNPFVLVPRLYEKGILERFVCELMISYHQNCLSAIAGGSTDITFSTLPNLQWLLLALGGVPQQFVRSFAPFYCDLRTRFAYYYPCVSFWEDANYCIIERSHIDYSFYALLGEPAITVIDSFYEIEIYGMTEVSDGSRLSTFLNGCIEKRFPRPSIRFHSKEKIAALLRSTEEVLKGVVATVAAKVTSRSDST